MQCDNRRQSGTSRAGKVTCQKSFSYDFRLTIELLLFFSIQNFIARNKNAIKDKSRKETAKKKEIETRKEPERR